METGVALWAAHILKVGLEGIKLRLVETEVPYVFMRRSCHGSTELGPRALW